MADSEHLFKTTFQLNNVSNMAELQALANASRPMKFLKKYAWTPEFQKKFYTAISTSQQHKPLTKPAADMSHTEKMQEAIKRAPLTKEMWAELGDIKTLVASMIVVSGILIGIAATGYGAIVEAVAAALLLLGIYLSGSQILDGIYLLIDFYKLTKKATTEKDLTEAGNYFAQGLAKVGIGTFLMILSVVGARKFGQKQAGKSNLEGHTPSKDALKGRTDNAKINENIYSQLKTQYDKTGAKSIQKSYKSAVKTLKEHQEKLPNLEYKSQVQKTIENVTKQVNTLRKFMKDNNIEIPKVEE